MIKECSVVVWSGGSHDDDEEVKATYNEYEIKEAARCILKGCSWILLQLWEDIDS